MNSMVCITRKMVLASLALFLITSLGLVHGDALAKAGDIKTAKMKITLSGPRATTMPVGDNPAHFMGIFKGTGTAVFSDGQKAQYQAVMTMDVFRGSFADSQGYSKFTFKDGSVVFSKWQSSFSGLDKAGRPTFQGKGKLIKGTGRFQGIQGTIAFISSMMPPDKEHPNGYTGSEAVWNYTLPSK